MHYHTYRWDCPPKTLSSEMQLSGQKVDQNMHHSPPRNNFEDETNISYLILVPKSKIKTIQFTIIKYLNN